MIFKQVQIDKFIRQPDKNIKAILVYGSNEGLQLDTVKRLAKSICPNLQDAFQVAELNAAAVASDIGILYGEFNGQSLMGGRRVIIIREVSNEITKHLRKMFEQSSSDNLLLMCSSGLNKKSSLVKLAEDSDDMAVFACYDDKNEDIYNILKTMGMTFESAAIQLLCSRLSNDRMINLTELDKLTTYMGEAKNVTPEIINKIISDTSDSSIEDIIYNTLDGDKVKALNFYSRYVSEGNEPVSVVRSMFYHFMKFLSCHAAVENGDSPDRAMQQLTPKIIFYRVDSFRRQLQLWNKEKTLRALEQLFSAEKDCKTTDLPSYEIVSMLLLRFASAAKR